MRTADTHPLAACTGRHAATRDDTLQHGTTRCNTVQPTARPSVDSRSPSARPVAVKAPLARVGVNCAPSPLRQRPLLLRLRASLKAAEAPHLERFASSSFRCAVQAFATRTRAARPGDARPRLVQHTTELTKHFEHEDTSGKGFIPMTVRLRVVSPEVSHVSATLLGDASAARPRKGSWLHIHNRAPRREARISAVCASRCTQPRPRLTQRSVKALLGHSGPRGTHGAQGSLECEGSAALRAFFLFHVRCGGESQRCASRHTCRVVLRGPMLSARLWQRCAGRHGRAVWHHHVGVGRGDARRGVAARAVDFAAAPARAGTEGNAWLAPTAA